ncbi:peptidyl-tRNA hydrolase [Candidatus Micrarchaeota archaeon]|nr:peptidyl-tRNA hydrolase [Candidatus Micrarchaeota archaeon]
MGFKQVLVVRTDLGMGKGKIASQVAHASIASYKEALKKNAEIVEKWEASGSEKVILKVKTKKELVDLVKLAKEKMIPCVLIVDAGKTQIKAGEPTCLGLGPWDEQEIDEITGELKLL